MKNVRYTTIVFLIVVVLCSSCAKTQTVDLSQQSSSHVVLEDDQQTKDQFKREEKASKGLLSAILLGIAIGISAL